jgi:AcrR family transcriptional regulator
VGRGYIQKLYQPHGFVNADFYLTRIKTLVILTINSMSIESLTSGKRKLQKESTRIRIIATAKQLFGEKGIIATTTQEVALEAGVAHGTVFAHFPTQEQLLTAVIEEFGQTVAGRLHKMVGLSADTAQALRAHLQGLIESESLYARMVIEGGILPPPARTTLIMVQSAISHHISEIAERDMEAGIIQKMPVHLLFNTWLALIHYYLANGDLFAPAGSVLEKCGAQLHEHFMRLISNQHSRRRIG